MGSDTDSPNSGQVGGFLPVLDRIEDSSGRLRSLLLSVPSWITPNRVTVFRGLLVVPAMVMLIAGAYWWSWMLLLAAVLLDAVDGALARSRNQKSEFGAFLDPLADKVLICAPLLTLAVTGPLDTIAGWTIALSITTVEAGLVAVRIYKKRRGVATADGRTDIGARNVGKHKMRAQSLGLSVIIIGLALDWSGMTMFGVYLMGFALLLGVASFMSHLPSKGCAD